MSTDPTQIMQQPVAPQQVAVLDINSLIQQVRDAVTPQAVDAAKRLATSLHQESLQAIDGVVQDVEANRKQIEATAASIGESYAKRLTSPRIQAVLIIGTAATIWIGSLAILLFYLAGSAEAKGIVGWACAAFGGSSIGLAVLHQLGFLGATGTQSAPVATALLQPAQFTTGLVSTTPTVVSVQAAQ